MQSKITLVYLVSGHSHSENVNARSIIKQISRKETICTPAEWEAVIQCALKENLCTLEVLEHSDIIDFKSSTAFPALKTVMLGKTE